MPVSEGWSGWAGSPKVADVAGDAVGWARERARSVEAGDERTTIRGSSMQKVEPLPSPGLLARMEPPWSSTRCLTIERPRPRPPWRRERRPYGHAVAIVGGSADSGAFRRQLNAPNGGMAEDMIEVMEQLGHQRFFLIGHDRGARVSHRMCLDHPERVMKLCLLDMLPTYYVWTNTTREWALGTWHWAFLAQPEPFPQTMINAVTPEWFLTNRGGIPRQRPKIVMDEFIRCFTPKTISGACRDYRAGATINFEMDAADKDKKIATPLLVLWGTRGASPTDEYPTVWRKFASNLETIEPLATGHYIQEEMPEQCLDRFFKFFVA